MIVASPESPYSQRRRHTRRRSTPGRARRRQRHINTCTHTHEPRPVACVCPLAFPSLLFLFQSSLILSSFALPLFSIFFLFMLLFSRFFYPLFTHARSATKRETHSRETSRKRGRHARTRLAFAHGVTSTILVRDANFARARSVGSRSRESRLYSVESRSSVPGSPAVPAYYSRESSRTARSLVHSVPGAVGCGNPPALYLLLSQLLSVSPLHSFSLTPSLFRSPTLSLSFFDSRFLSLSFFPSFSLTLSLFLFLPLPLSLALGYSFCTAHATK